MEHLLGGLEGLKVSVTGLQDVDDRVAAKDAVQRAGGEFSADLLRDCTHLVAYAAAGAKYRCMQTRMFQSPCACSSQRAANQVANLCTHVQVCVHVGLACGGPGVAGGLLQAQAAAGRSTICHAAARSFQRLLSGAR